MLAVALDTGRNVVLEGPPGTGKSTLLRLMAAEAGLAVAFVEGNAELTPARLLGAHDPAMVLAAGYVPEAFVDGPLLTALRDGGLLYIEELNRVPEETLNVLITALAEREVTVPRLGHVAAHERFRLVAAMNPFDAVGTARVSQAVADRVCRIALTYQDEPAERRIVEHVTARDGPALEFGVALARATRGHPDVRMGSSVRGAIDFVLLADGLAGLRAQAGLQRETALDAALAALTGRIRVEDGHARTAEDIVAELVDRLWAERERAPGKADRPGPGGQDRAAGQGGAPDALDRAARRTLSRAELGDRHPDLQQVSPQVGRLDRAALDDLLAADPDAATALLSDLAVATDPALRREARRLAAQVFVRLARIGPARRGGVRRLAPRHRSPHGDLDLDRTLERTGGVRPRSGDDLVVRDWTAPRRAVCLLLDHSGSMRGNAVARSALTAASAVLACGERVECSVLAFASRVLPLSDRDRPRAPAELVDSILALRGAGTTDLAAALRAAARDLAARPADERLVVLLSDCAPTAGGDPLGALAGIDRLDVLSPGGEAESSVTAEALAARGRGRLIRVTSVREVPAALTALLS